MRVGPRESGASQDRSSVVSMPAQLSPKLDCSRGLNGQHTQSTVSFDSLEMQPERPEQISQSHQPEQVDLAMPQPTRQQDSLAVSPFGVWPTFDVDRPEMNQITKHVTFSVTREPADLYFHNHQVPRASRRTGSDGGRDTRSFKEEGAASHRDGLWASPPSADAAPRASTAEMDPQVIIDY